MTANEGVSVRVGDLGAVELKVSVTVSREVRFRLWLASQLVALAGWILGGRGTLERLDP